MLILFISFFSYPCPLYPFLPHSFPCTCVDQSPRSRKRRCSLGEGLGGARVGIDCLQVTQRILYILSVGLRYGEPFILPDEEEEEVLLEFHQSGFTGGGVHHVGNLLDFICVVVVAAVTWPIRLVTGGGEEESG